MQGHSGSSEEIIQRCIIISTTEQAISMKLATKVGILVSFFLHDLDFENIYMACGADS